MAGLRFRILSIISCPSLQPIFSRALGSSIIHFNSVLFLWTPHRGHSYCCCYTSLWPTCHVVHGLAGLPGLTGLHGLPGGCGRRTSAEKAWLSTLCILKTQQGVNNRRGAEMNRSSRYVKWEKGWSQCGWLKLSPIQRAPGAVKAWGWRRPTQSPKHLCCTLRRGSAQVTKSFTCGWT